MVTSEVPSGWGEDELSKFIDTAQENTYATFQRGPDSYRRLSDIDATFREAVSCLNKYPEPVVPPLFVRSHGCFLGGARLALSTQVYEANPVLRSCLEAALYGLLVAKKPELQRTWVNRNESPKSLTKMKGEFTIRACFQMLQAEDPRCHAQIKQLYDRTIDFGAHPNPLGVLSNLEFRSDDDGHKISTHYMTDNTVRIVHALKTTAQIGVGALWIFRLAIPKRFEIMGLVERIEELAEGL